MAREVRITVDDDEVFERMKARKRELDLSWEEVLHRGLREIPERSAHPEPPEPPEHSEAPEPPTPSESSGSRHQRGHGSAGDARRGHGGRGGPGSRGDEEDIGDIVDQFRTQLRDQVQRSVKQSMESSLGVDIHDREMSDLEAAEDAVLRFPFLDDERPAHRVPLRVDLRSSREGLEVDVVAVRQGKSVRDLNRFDRSARRQVNERLARGDTATLEFEAGAESYAVAPVLSWTRTDGGDPTVAAVEIDEVVFDDGN